MDSKSDIPHVIKISPVAGVAPEGVEMKLVNERVTRGRGLDPFLELLYMGTPDPSGDGDVLAVAVQSVGGRGEVKVEIATETHLRDAHLKSLASRNLEADPQAKLSAQVAATEENLKLAVNSVGWHHLCSVAEIRRQREGQELKAERNAGVER